jgi:hypothetical protein
MFLLGNFAADSYQYSVVRAAAKFIIDDHNRDFSCHVNNFDSRETGSVSQCFFYARPMYILYCRRWLLNLVAREPRILPGQQETLSEDRDRFPTDSNQLGPED